MINLHRKVDESYVTGVNATKVNMGKYLENVTSTQELELIVEELALNIKSYPESDKKTIMQLALELNSKLVYGNKQEYKNKLISLLGYDTKGHEIRGSLKTISENIMYFVDSGITPIRRLVRKYSSVLNLDIKDTIEPKINYLKLIGVKDNDIWKVILTHPQILVYDIDKTMEKRVKYLKSIGASDEDIGKIVTKLPTILVYDVEKNLKPSYEYLNEKFGITIEDIVSTPSLFSASLNKKIKPRYEFLELKGLEEKGKARDVAIFSDKKFCLIMNISLEEYTKFKKDYLKRLV